MRSFQVGAIPSVDCFFAILISHAKDIVIALSPMGVEELDPLELLPLLRDKFGADIEHVILRRLRNHISRLGSEIVEKAAKHLKEQRLRGIDVEVDDRNDESESLEEYLWLFSRLRICLTAFAMLDDFAQGREPSKMAIGENDDPLRYI
jgi:hypothetical protein